MRAPARRSAALLALAAVLIVATPPAAAQAVDWLARHNGGFVDADAALAGRGGLAVDVAGNIYVTGRANTPDPEFRTLKYSPSGALVWSVGFGAAGRSSGEAQAIAVDAAGNAYVTGVAKDFDGQSNDFLTIKYAASDGHVIWERSFDGAAHGADQATAIALDAQGNAFVTGTSEAALGTGVRTVKYRASDGAELWSAGHENAGGAYPVAVVADASGGVVVAAQSGEHFRAMKYAAATGGLVWSVSYAVPGSVSGRPLDLALDPGGNAYVTGYSYDGSVADFRVLKHSAADGSVLWSVGLGEGQGRAITVDPAGNAYVTGAALTARLASADGAVTWSVVQSLIGNAIALDGAGDVAITGRSSGPTGEASTTIKYAGSSGATLWSASSPVPLPASTDSVAIAIDALGDVVSAGTTNTLGHHDFRTFKRAGSSGTELFSAGSGTLVGTADSPGLGKSLSVDSAGGVVGTGTAWSPLGDMVTLRYAASGAVVWSSTWDGPEHLDDRAAAVALDATDDVYVTGASGTAAHESDMRTVKYAGATGTVVWTASYDGATHGGDEGRAVAVGSSGDVYVTGLSHNGSDDDWRTIRYSGADGHVVWSVAFDSGGHDHVVALAVDGAGNAYVTGTALGVGPHLRTVKYSAADGSVLWSQGFDGGFFDTASALVLDSSGNAYLTATSSHGDNDDFRTIKYASADGAILWNRVFDGAAGGDDTATAVAVDQLGNAYVAGNSWTGTGHEVRLLKYAAADGTVLWSAVAGSLTSAAAVALDAGGDVFVAGGGSNGLDFDLRAARLAGSDGRLLWSVGYDGAHGNDDARALAVRDGVAYVVGSSLVPHTGIDFVTIRYVTDNLAPLAPTALSSTSHPLGGWGNATAIGMAWSGAVDPPPASGLLGYSVAFDTTSGTVPDTTVDVPQSQDPHETTSAPLPEGQGYYFHVRSCDRGGNCSAALHAGPYAIDATAPVGPASLTSSSHTPGVPSNETTLALQWTAAVDPPSNGVASGIDGYGWFVDDAPGTSCRRVKVAEEGTTSVIMDMQLGTWYAHVCAVDNAGNWSPVATTGPYLIGDPADLSLTLVDDADPIHVNGTVTYTATYANAGPSAAPATWLYVTLPPGLGFVSSLPGEPDCSSSGALVKCWLGDLSSSGGGSVTVTAQAQQGAKGQRVVTGRLRAATSDPDLSNNDVTQSTWVKFVKGDLQDDWSTDLFLRNVTTGENVAWLMNGTTRLSEAPIDPAGPTYATQEVSGVDDFDGDGRNDLAFWDSSTGGVEFWLMDGPTRSGDPVPLTGGSQPPPWSLAATADFDRDGWPDLLWRNTDTQKLVVWTLNGTARAGEIVPGPDQAVHANWQVVGAVDLNGDGPVDLLWYNVSTGKIVYWWMDASLQRITGNFTNPASAGNANWKVLATGDYGAGPGGVADTADVVWRNETSGKYVVWHLDLAGHRTAGTFTTPDAPTSPLDWTLVGPR